MNVEVDRRVFVGSVVTGFPLLVAGGAELAWAQREPGSSQVRDPVVSQVLTDMKRAVRGLSRAPSGEHARHLASSLRLLAAWGASNRFDDRVKTTLRGAMAREGREALLRREVDLATFKAEARQFGFDGTSSVPLPVLPSIDDTAKQRIIDAMLDKGVTDHWKALADMLESAATHLDRIAAARPAGVMLAAQTDPSICVMIRQEMYYLNLQMAFWCAPWFYWFLEPCGLTTSAFLGVATVSWWYSC
jgi:hypothetical protein